MIVICHAVLGAWASADSTTARRRPATDHDHQRARPARRAPPSDLCPGALCADRAGLQSGLARHRIGFAVGQIVDRAGPGLARGAHPSGTEQRRCPPAGSRRCGPRGPPRRAARPAARDRRRPRRRGARRRGAARRTARVRRPCSAGDLPVRVMVCHWLAMRPVVRTSGNSSSGASAGRRPCGVASRCARPSSGREDAVGVEPRRAGMRSSRARPLQAALGAQPRVADAGLIAEAAGGLPQRTRRRRPPPTARRSARRTPSRAPDRREDPPVGTRLAGRLDGAPSRATRAARSSSSCRPSPATARRGARGARARRSRSGSRRPGRSRARPCAAPRASRSASGMLTTGLVATIQIAFSRPSSSASNRSVAGSPGSGQMPAASSGRFHRRRDLVAVVGRGDLAVARQQVRRGRRPRGRPWRSAGRSVKAARRRGGRCCPAARHRLMSARLICVPCDRLVGAHRPERHRASGAGELARGGDDVGRRHAADLGGAVGRPQGAPRPARRRCPACARRGRRGRADRRARSRGASSSTAPGRCPGAPAGAGRRRPRCRCAAGRRRSPSRPAPARRGSASTGSDGRRPCCCRAASRQSATSMSA